MKDELLPPVVQNFVDLIGFESALLLVERLGGVSFSIPNDHLNNVNGERLVEIVGLEQAKRIVACFGGDVIYIPKCDKYLKLKRNRELIACVGRDIENGLSKTQAVKKQALAFRLSERWVIQLLQNQENISVSDGRQLDLNWM